MQATHFYKAFIAALILTAGFAIFWEYHWRSKGFPIAYNDDKVIWADARKQISGSGENQTVFIGDSRTKFDIDLATWKRLTGEDPVQLALVGTSPRPVLQHLADDETFRGKIIIGAQEPALFNVDTNQREKSAKDGIEYFQNETPAQHVNAPIDFMLESRVVFLEEGKFGLNALLNNLPIPNRKGVVIATGPPKEFSSSGRNRQARITDMLFKDTGLRNSVIRGWTISSARNRPPMKGDTLEKFLQQTKIQIDKIRARGGKVFFIRPPSSGVALERETKLYPKELYWDKLLEQTQTHGFYYTVNPATAVMTCPENSHLSPADAAVFTGVLIQFLKEKEGWSFGNPSSSHTQ